jgi:hypothetical protein
VQEERAILWVEQELVREPALLLMVEEPEEPELLSMELEQQVLLSTEQQEQVSLML